MTEERRDEIRRALSKCHWDLADAQAVLMTVEEQSDRLRARVAELEGALRPFAHEGRKAIVESARHEGFWAVPITDLLRAAEVAGEPESPTEKPEPVESLEQPETRPVESSQAETPEFEFPTLWSDRDVEKHTRGVLKVKSLRHWRLVGGGPAYFKIGRMVRYRPEDIREFLLGERRA